MAVGWILLTAHDRNSELGRTFEQPVHPFWNSTSRATAPYKTWPSASVEVGFRRPAAELVTEEHVLQSGFA